MRRIWEQMNPKRVAHRDERGRYRKGQRGHVKKPLTVAQKEANYILRKLHKGEQPDIDKFRAQRSAVLDREHREAVARHNLQRMGLL